MNPPVGGPAHLGSESRHRPIKNPRGISPEHPIQIVDTADLLREITRLSRTSSPDVAQVNPHIPKNSRLSELCSACASIFCGGARGPNWFNKWYEHHQSFDDFNRAVHMNCSICMVVKETFTGLGQNFSLKGALKYRASFSSNYEYFIEFAYMSNRDFADTHLVIYEGMLREAENVEPHLSSFDLRPSTGSREALDLCKYWLQRCRNQHARCGHRRSDALFRPSRLVYVDRADNGTMRARLHCADSIAEAEPYLTLSHCWGPEKFFTLRSSNLQQLEKNIDVEILSKTFQDALLLILELGFSYIWIDSLCIVQDSEEDWFSESSRMGDIYKNSMCNIAATGFSDGLCGFFVNRDLNRIQCPKIYVDWSSDPRYFYLVDDRHNEVTKAPLNRRGWVLQERLLSPCALHFGKHQIYWECFESFSSEIFPDGGSMDLYTPAFQALRFIDEPTKDEDLDVVIGDEAERCQSPKSKHKTVTIPLRQGDISPKLYDVWYEVVEAYSEGCLTKSEDKFLAVSAIAKEIRRMMGSRYLAGLWEHTVMRDLLWCVLHDQRVSLPLTYRAPTWSWASLDARISYSNASYEGDEPERFHAEFVDAQLSYLTDDDTGPMTGGHIRVSGQLIEVECVSEFEWRINGAKLDLLVRIDIEPRVQEGIDCALTNRGSNILELSMGSDMKRRYLQNSQLYLFPVHTGVAPDTDMDELTGLILVRTGRSRLEYMRLGLFNTESAETREIILTSSSKLEGEAENGRCTIVLV